jgi:hypothetical protein
VSIVIELPPGAQHRHRIDVPARTLIACLHAMVTGLPATEPG